MSQNIQIARTTLGEIRALLIDVDVLPDIHLMDFAVSTAELPNEARVIIEINGGFVTYGVETDERREA